MGRLKNKEIAEMLGISTAAVSLALNNKPGVSEETRGRVKALVNQGLANAPHIAPVTPGSSLMFVIHKRSGAIVIDKPFFSDLLESVQVEAARLHFSLTVFHYFPTMDLNDFVSALNEQRAIGAILLATEMQEDDLAAYKRLKIPFILVDGAFDYESYDSVTIDNRVAMMRVVAYAHKLGHRSIGYLKSNVFINNFGHRYAGYLSAVRHFALDPDTCLEIPLSPSIEQSYLEMKQFLSQRGPSLPLPTCFVSDLDYIAIGAMNALKESGYRIPEDVSIIGFDDVVASAACDPPLTPVRVNRNDIGRIASNILLERILMQRLYTTNTQISSDLIIRNSVKKLN